MPIHTDIRGYNKSQSAGDQGICDALAKTIDQHLPDAENKIWHAHPVWFLDGNPIVGYSKLKDCIRLLFWIGQSFGEPDLKPEGSFKAAEVRYTLASQIAAKDLKRWLKKSIEIQWDYKNIVKRKGKLERVKQADAARGAGFLTPPAQENDGRNQEMTDWRNKTLARGRRLIQQAAPEVVEEVKWRKPSNSMRGVPVWSHAGILCTGETYQQVVKLTFAKGASLKDPDRLFNSSLDGSVRRAIDIHEGEQIHESAFKTLIRQAVALNSSGKSKRSKNAKS